MRGRSSAQPASKIFGRHQGGLLFRVLYRRSAGQGVSWKQQVHGVFAASCSRRSQRKPATQGKCICVCVWLMVAGQERGPSEGFAVCETFLSWWDVLYRGERSLIILL